MQSPSRGRRAGSCSRQWARGDVGRQQQKLLVAWAGVGRAKHNPIRNISRWRLLFALPAAVSLPFPAGRDYYSPARVPRHGRCTWPVREMQFVAKEQHGYVLASVLNALNKTAGHGNINPIKQNQ